MTQPWQNGGADLQRPPQRSQKTLISKVEPPLWGKKLRTGQRIGLALVWKRVGFLKQPNRHSLTLPQPVTVLQIIPTVNECFVETDTDVPQARADGQIDHYVKKWHIGVVSQSAYEPPTKGKIALALHDSQQRTDLPQIEILMI